MKITKTEAAILIHRLDCSDGLLEVYNDSYDQELTWDEMNEVCEKLIEECKAGNIQEPIEGLRKFALEDAVEGSTFFGNMEHAVADGELSKGKFLAYRKAAISLSDKFGVEAATY